MIDQIAQLAAAAAPMPQALPPPTQAVNPDPADTQAFSLMMDGSAAPGLQSKPVRTELNQLQRALLTQGTEFHDRFQALDQGRQSILSADISDPMMFMWRTVDFSFQSTSLFTHLNLASGLATAVNNSFNSLFKNQA